MLKAKSIRRILAVILSCAVVMAALLVPVTVSAEDSAEIISGTLVNGDMEDGSWYAWAGDQTLTANDLDGEGNVIEVLEYTGTQLDALIASTNNKYSGEMGMQFRRHDTENLGYPNSGQWNESETVAGCKTTIDEAKFALMELSDMTFSIWIYTESDLSAFDVKYRAVNNDGTYGAYHTTSLKDSVTVSGSWVQATAKLDNMWIDSADAKTIEVELFTRSYCSVYLDEADVTASKADPNVVKGTLINGGMEEGSWYAWAGDDVIYGEYTGNALDALVTSPDIKHSGEKGMQFRRSDTEDFGYPNSGQWNESETVVGCKTTIDEAKFAQMDLSDMTFSIWANVDTDTLYGEKAQFHQFYVKYRAVNNDGTYGNYHTANLIGCITEGRTWTKATAKLDNMWIDCDDTKTIEVEIFTRSYCSVYLDEADITASKADPSVVKGTLVNGGMEEGSWYAWAGEDETFVYEKRNPETKELIETITFTGPELDAAVVWTDEKHSGQQSMRFWRDHDFYPNDVELWNLSVTFPGCKTTIKETKFAQMDLSDMTFSIWANVQGTLSTFTVKYRAVNIDGTYGKYHEKDLNSSLNGVSYQWVQATAELDDMRGECANAKTIEFEICTSSYCSVYLDEADVTAAKMDPTVVKHSLVNGGMEEGSWYAWAGDQTLTANDLDGEGNVENVLTYTGAQLDALISSTDKKCNGEKGMQFRRNDNENLGYPNIGRWNESETVAGCKTTIGEAKFALMDLSDMTFSIWINAEDGLTAFNVKYRAVNNDGTYGNYHTAYLSSSITTYNTWIQVTTKLDNMTSECADAKTIEFELYALSYCSVYVDEADVTASRIKEAHTGDVTGNGGAADAEDIKAVKMFLLRVENIDTYDYDVNGDGEINVLDLVKLKKLMCGIA